MTAPLCAHPLDPVQPYKLARELGRPVARGWMPEVLAQAVLTMAAVKAAPDHPDLNHYCTRLSWTMQDAARAQMPLERAL